MKVGDVYGGDWLKADHIKDHAPVNLQITKVAQHVFQDGNTGEKKPRITLGFRGTDRVLGLNWTNANTIISLYGDETDNWLGKHVTLEVRRVEAFGKMTDAIRVAEQAPGQAAQQQTTERTAPPVPDANPAADNFEDDIPF